MRPYDTCITIAETRFTLRPSIGAAFRLMEKYGDMPSLSQQTLAGSVTAIADIITACSLEYDANRTLSTLVEKEPLGELASDLLPPMLAHLANLSGFDKHRVSKAHAKSSSTKPIASWVNHYLDLYGIATGFLRMSPADAWEASPVEIMLAYDKRVEILQAMNGVVSEEAERERTVNSLMDTRRDPDARERLLKRRGKRVGQR